MTYKLISSKVVIGRVFDRFNINYSGFLPRVPNWVNSAIKQLESFPELVPDNNEGTVADYKCALPDDLAVLDGISYLGQLLPRIPRINEYDATKMGNLYHKNYNYQFDKKGYIITSFEEGTVTFYYQKYLAELDTVTKLYFPLIPDNEVLLDALDHYIIYRCLQRNHKVIGYNLRDNSPYTNPALYWDTKLPAVRNSISSFDLEERHAISSQIRTFLVANNFRSEILFNPYNKI